MDLELLRIYAMTDKTTEDVETIMSLTQALPFVVNYNNATIHQLISRNMKLQYFNTDQHIFDSSKNLDINFVIYLGSANWYFSSTKNQKESLTLIREMFNGDSFGSFEIEIMKQNNTRIEKILAIAKEPSKIIVFENREYTDQPAIKTKREVMVTQRLNDPNKPQFDPEIFWFDNPQKIIDIITSAKNAVNEKFKSANKFEGVFKKWKNEKEYCEILSNFPQKKEFKEVFNFIDTKYGNDYSVESILDLKLGIVALKCVESVSKAETDMNSSLEELKNKFYDQTNTKNRNWLQLNIDKELEADEFSDYIYDQINKTKNLDSWLKKKKTNENKIEHNKKTIKKEGNLLLNSYYCIYCHKRPRDAISTNCNHLLICEECMKKAKVCPRCGVNIDNYHRIYRS